MWIVAWETSTGRHLEEAPDQDTAETRVTVLRNKGITRTIAYELEDQEQP